jgi:hypothetical protein
MINKDNTFLERKQWNHPEAVNEALDSLPSNYVKQACFRTMERKWDHH